jgi:hypothetical protein
VAYNYRDGYRMSIMLTSLLRTALPVLVASTLGLQLAHADIYTWADPSGSVNVSNLAPPDGARVISVVHTSAADAARENAARDAARRAETLALEERVRQLESEAEARRQSPPQVVYAPPPPAPYWSQPTPTAVQYVVSMAPPAYNQTCDPGWLGCSGWFPGFYPSVVYVRARDFRHFPTNPGRPHFGAPPMGHMVGHFGRG